MNEVKTLLEQVRTLLSKKEWADLLSRDDDYGRLAAGITEGRILSDADAIHEFFPDIQDSEHSKYLNFKSRFKKLLANIVLTARYSKGKETSRLDYRKCQHRLAVGKILLIFRLKEAGIPFIKKALSIAEKREFTEERMTCYRLLQRYYAFIGDGKFLTYRDKFEEAYTQYKTENDLTGQYNEMVYFLRNQPSGAITQENRKYFKKLLSNVESIVKDPTLNLTYSAREMYLQLSIICYESLRDDENLVRTGYKAVDFYRKSRMEQQVSGIYVKLYPALAELGREKEAEKASRNIEENLPETSYNMQLYRRVKTNRLLWEGKYREAYTLYKKTAPHLESLNLTGYERQAWSFTIAVIALGLKYTDKSGLTKLSEEESQFAYSEDFGTLKERCSKLKDKWGVKPFLKSVVFINALMDENDDLVYYLDNYEAIQRFLRRYLSEIKKQSPRAGAYFSFVFKLWNLPPADKFEKLADEVRQELAQYTQPSWSSDLGTLEFIKLEELIEMIRAFYPKYLEKKKLR